MGGCKTHAAILRQMVRRCQKQMQGPDLSKDAVAAKSGGVFSRNRLLALVSLFAAAAVLTASDAAGHACVWKVTAPKGGTLYLGGSVHALRSIDYPLPPAYNRAF